MDGFTKIIIALNFQLARFKENRPSIDALGIYACGNKGKGQIHVWETPVDKPTCLTVEQAEDFLHELRSLSKDTYQGQILRILYEIQNTDNAVR